MDQVGKFAHLRRRVCQSIARQIQSQGQFPGRSLNLRCDKAVLLGVLDMLGTWHRTI